MDILVDLTIPTSSETHNLGSVKKPVARTNPSRQPALDREHVCETGVLIDINSNTVDEIRTGLVKSQLEKVGRECNEVTELTRSTSSRIGIGRARVRSKTIAGIEDVAGMQSGREKWSPWLLDDDCENLLDEEDVPSFNSSASFITTPLSRQPLTVNASQNRRSVVQEFTCESAVGAEPDTVLSAQEVAELFEQATTIAVRISLAAKKLGANDEGPPEIVVDDKHISDSAVTTKGEHLDHTPPPVATTFDSCGRAISFSDHTTSTPISGNSLVEDAGKDLADLSSASAAAVVRGSNVKPTFGKLFTRPTSMGATGSVVNTGKDFGGMGSRLSVVRRSLRVPAPASLRRNDSLNQVNVENISAISHGPRASVGGTSQKPVEVTRADIVTSLPPRRPRNLSSCSFSSIGSAASSTASDKAVNLKCAIAAPRLIKPSVAASIGTRSNLQRQSPVGSTKPMIGGSRFESPQGVNRNTNHAVGGSIARKVSVVSNALTSPKRRPSENNINPVRGTVKDSPAGYSTIRPSAVIKASIRPPTKIEVGGNKEPVDLLIPSKPRAAATVVSKLKPPQPPERSHEALKPAVTSGKLPVRGASCSGKLLK